MAASSAIGFGSGTATAAVTGTAAVTPAVGAVSAAPAAHVADDAAVLLVDSLWVHVQMRYRCQILNIQSSRR